MLTKVTLMAFKASKSLQLYQNTPECIRNCAIHIHTIQSTCKNYEERQKVKIHKKENFTYQVVTDPYFPSPVYNFCKGLGVPQENDE